MKFNKWTLGLAAVGAVSMASAVRADEAKLSQVQTALSNTTLSGYVDTSVNYVAGNQANGTSVIGTPRDQFGLDNFTLSLDKPLDDSPWASGYHVDLNTGSAAINGLNAYNANGYMNVRQAYVTLRTPVGNGIDWKMGLQDGITGYEGNTSWSNPNFTRSYGYAINPASYVGLLGTYKICDALSATAGIVNRGFSLAGYGQSHAETSSFDYVGSLSLTAPDSWGFLKGSSLNLQTVQGFDEHSVDNYSVNGTLSTPWQALKIGVAWDRVQSLASSIDGNIYGLYATFQATDKLALALRGELVDNADLSLINGAATKGEEVTATVSYDLWANVVTRAEVRWDHAETTGLAYHQADNSVLSNQITFALNVVYKF